VYAADTFPLGDEKYLVAPYWVNIDTTVNGDVWHRQSTSPELLTRASSDVQQAFPLLPQFIPTHLYIVTWANVGANGGVATQVSVCSTQCASKSHLVHINVSILAASM